MIAWCAAVTAVAAPARPLYQAPESAAPPTFFDVRDTAWAGTGPESADRNIFFHRDGTLAYQRGQKGFGTWKMNGNTVYFEFNKGYREFRGVIRGNVIEGDSWNVTGKRWHTSLKLVPLPTPMLGSVP
jgi:hypothetical protein